VIAQVIEVIANRHNGEKKCPKKCIFSNFPIHASYAPAHPSSHLHWYMERLPTARSTTADHPQQYCKASAVRLQPICTMTVIHRAPSIRQSRFLKKFPQRSHFFLFPHNLLSLLSPLLSPAQKSPTARLPITYIILEIAVIAKPTKTFFHTQLPVSYTITARSSLTCPIIVFTPPPLA